MKSSAFLSTNSRKSLGAGILWVGRVTVMKAPYIKSDTSREHPHGPLWIRIKFVATLQILIHIHNNKKGCNEKNIFTFSAHRICLFRVNDQPFTFPEIN